MREMVAKAGYDLDKVLKKRGIKPGRDELP
jgi:hypothetical protein